MKRKNSWKRMIAGILSASMLLSGQAASVLAEEVQNIEAAEETGTEILESVPEDVPEEVTESLEPEDVPEEAAESSEPEDVPEEVTEASEIEDVVLEEVAGELETKDGILEEETESEGLALETGFEILEIEEMASEEASALLGSEVSISSDSVVLYALDSGYTEKLSIPSDFAQNYQIQVTGSSANAVFKVLEGDSVTVSSDGVITPVKTVWYKWENYWSNMSDGTGTQATRTSYTYGESVIEVTTAEKVFQVSVNVVSYAQYYAEQQMENYIAANIDDTMTTFEKVDAICQYVASFDYDANYSSAISMIVCGGGDCWASTSLILAMCSKLDIPAYSRYGAGDPGAGSGHMNCLVDIDGTVYMAEAGFAMTAPRYYSLTPCGEFSYTFLSDGTIEIRQYEGLHTDVIVPETINGYTVSSIGKGAFYHAAVEITSVELPGTLTSIGEQAFYRCEELTSVNLPDGLQTIGSNAFSGCTGLTQIAIPDSVTSISEFAFTDSENLAKIEVSAQNENYSSKDGVLFDKNGTTLLTCPCGREAEYTVPSGTGVIGRYAFYMCKKLTDINLPEGITELGEGAFGNCSGLEKITLPESLKKIDAFAFYYCSGVNRVVIPSGVTEIGNSICLTNIAVCAQTGTAAETYAKENGYKFWETDENGKIYVCAEWFDEIEDDWYSGEEVRPNIDLVYPNLIKVTEGTDYTVTYQNNVKPGTNAAAVITGIGDFTGTAELKFTIHKITQRISGHRYFWADTQTKQFNLNQSAEGKLSYSSNDTGVAKVDANGNVTIVGAGTTTITVTAAETEYCKETTISVYLTVENADWVDEQNQKKTQQISCTESYKKAYGSKAFTLNASAKGKLSFVSDNKKVVTVNAKGKVTIKGTGKATITVKAAATSTYKAATKKITITVTPKKMKLSSVKSTKKKQIQIKWKKDSRATGYQIVYATNKKFTKGKKSIFVKSNKTTSKSIKKLSSKKNYYVKIRAYKTVNGAKIYGAYSEVKWVKVK